MRLGNILEDVKCRMPNAFPDDILVTWLQSGMRELYKALALREGYMFKAAGGQMLYPLPRDIRPDLISAVVVGKKELLPRRIGETGSGRYWFCAAEGFIGLCPSPRRGEPVSIWYRARPAHLLTEAECQKENIVFSEQEIRLDEDYEELLKLSLCIMIAEAREDVALANNYKISYNLLLQRARQQQYGKDGKYPVTKIVQ